MEAIKIKGEVLNIHPVEEKGDFKKQELIIKTEGDYPQVFLIEFLKEKIELLDFVSIGEDINVMCNLRGRQWTAPDGTTRYFLSLNGWKVDKI